MITADAGIDSVLVQFTVNDNGVDVGRGRAAARAIGDGEGGTITLIRQLSEAVATIPQNSNCDSDNGADLSQNIGAVSLSAAAAQACRAEDPDVGYLAGITASCFTSLNADTGLAPDGRSAVMTFASSGSSNIVGEGEGTGYLFTHASLYVEFQIQGGPMAFQLKVADAKRGISSALYRGRLYNGTSSGDRPSVRLPAICRAARGGRGGGWRRPRPTTADRSR
ncbi:MAG: hypothetical protein IPH48_13065 [bacterium]|nr:hypothetical protein [bacterium]